MSRFRTPVKVEDTEPAAATVGGEGVTVSATKSASSSSSVTVAVAASDETSTRPPTVGIAVTVTVRSGSAMLLFTPDKVKVAVFAVVPSATANDRDDGEGVAVIPSGRSKDRTTGSAAAPEARATLRLASIVTAPVAASSSRLARASPALSLREIRTTISSLIVTTVSPGVPTVARAASGLVSVTLKVSPVSSSLSLAIGIVIVPATADGETVTCPPRKPFVRSADCAGLVSPCARV